MAPKRKAATADAPAADAAALKGKKTAAGASAPVVDLKKSDGDWVKSTLKEAHLDKLREEGMLPPADQLFVRAPSPNWRYSPSLALTSAFVLRSFYLGVFRFPSMTLFVV